MSLVAANTTCCAGRWCVKVTVERSATGLAKATAIGRVLANRSHPVAHANRRVQTEWDEIMARLERE